MNEPKITIGCVANLYSRQMHFEKAGDIEHGHKHSFDHFTFLARGSLNVAIDGIESVFNAPQMIYIHKDKNHELTALEDDTIAICIHALHDKDTGDIIPLNTIPEGIFPREQAMPIITD